MSVPSKSRREQFFEWLEVALVFAFVLWALVPMSFAGGFVGWLIGLGAIFAALLASSYFSPAKSQLYQVLWRRQATQLRGYEVQLRSQASNQREGQ